jgi:hypothetical protein
VAANTCQGLMRRKEISGFPAKAVAASYLLYLIYNSSHVANVALELKIPKKSHG